MAYRKTPVVNGEIYHVYNRSNGQQKIFLSAKDYQRTIEVFRFYQYGKPPLRFSFYNRLPKDQKPKFLEELYLNKPIVDIICFCLMPNHFHFLLINPITAFLVRTMEELENYQWSSYPDYIHRGETYIKKGIVLDHFRSIADYKQFMANQVDYQRKLDRIKHILLE